MIKQWFHGFIAITILSLLVATFAPAPVAAANRSLGAGVEQAMNQGNDGQHDQDNNGQNRNQQGQNQQGQQQNQGQGGPGQQQGNNQVGCFAGADQGSANFPAGCWTSLGAGGRHWYQFRYQGLPADRNDNDEDDSSSRSSNSQPPTVNARLKMDTPGCISFWVMTQERLQNPDPDGDGIEEPVGAGAPVVTQENNNSDDSSSTSSDSNNRDESVLNWQGGANANTTFYIIVRNNRDFSCAYSLSIEGAGVPVPGQQAQPQNQQENQNNNNGSTNNSSDNNGSNNNGSNSNGAQG